MPTLTLDLLQERLKNWQGCDLAKTSNPVLGEGSAEAEVMFIGEAPGQRERLRALRRRLTGPGRDGRGREEQENAELRPVLHHHTYHAKWSSP